MSVESVESTIKKISEMEVRERATAVEATTQTEAGSEPGMDLKLIYMPSFVLWFLFIFFPQSRFFLVATIRMLTGSTHALW